MKATKAQIAKLQTVYSQMAAREIGVEKSREARIAWAKEVLGREIASFSDLSRGDAIRLIDTAQAPLGVAYKPYSGATSREQARRAGLDGRKDVEHEFGPAPQLVGDRDMLQIYSFIERLGWTKENFSNWLSSARSPFAQRDSKDIKTVADANQVRWALKRMLKREKKWDREAA